MPEEVEIVTLPVREWRAYRELRLRALQDAPQAFAQSHAAAAARPEHLWQDRLREAESGESWLFFARRDERLVGMLGAFRTDEDRALGRATIVGAYVDPTERGRGIARQLMAALLERLAATGAVTTARLSVNAEQVAAVRLYESFGFRMAEEAVVTLGDGQQHRELILDKPLALPAREEARPAPCAAARTRRPP